MSVNTEEILIDLKNVSKDYRIFEKPNARISSGLYEIASGFVPNQSNINKLIKNKSKQFYKLFPALKTINLQIRRGESVGVIGRNGSGKSTLLQIIAGTTRASTGDIKIKGKIAALLELGSAFHPQFSGRDNVYLNCAIMGLNKESTDAVFEDIAEFADIGDFMDQPVRMYSSGMATRLAFSVQIVLQPDILIIDEALGVGDAYFQSRCYRRIRQMLDNGVTLIFVSHATNIIRELCNRTILLNEGNMIMDAAPAPTLDMYFKMDIEYKKSKKRLHEESNKSLKEERDIIPSQKEKCYVLDEIKPDIFLGKDIFAKKSSENRIVDPRASIINVQLINSNGKMEHCFNYGAAVRLRVLTEYHANVTMPTLAYQIFSTTGIGLVHVDTRYSEKEPENYLANTKYISEWKFNLNLQHGDYYILISLSLPPSSLNSEWDTIDHIPHAYDFSVSTNPKGMLGAFTTWSSELATYQIT